MAAYGIEDQGDDPNAGSTDMANVSWVCPTIHPDLAIAPEGTPGHSIRFRDAAISPRADATTSPERPVPAPLVRAAPAPIRIKARQAEAVRLVHPGLAVPVDRDHPVPVDSASTR